MPYVFRTDGPWGTGKGSDLDADEIDGNFWQAIQDIVAKAVQGVGIVDAAVVGNQLFFTLTDHSILGPYTLPTAQYSWRGPWAPSTSYFVNDIFTANMATYMVLVNHVSGTSFDPNATDGLGHNLYGILLESAIPNGGLAGAFLRKATGTDFDVIWGDIHLGLDITDVSIGHPADGQVLTYSAAIGKWTNQGSPWDFGFTFIDEPTPGGVIQTIPLTRDITIPHNMVGSVGVCESPPATTYSIDVTLDNVSVGTVHINTDGTYTFISGSTILGNAGQIVRFIAPPASPTPPMVSNAAATILAHTR